MDVTPALGRRALDTCKTAIRNRDRKSVSVAVLTILGWITLLVLDLLGEIEPPAEVAVKPTNKEDILDVT